MISLLHFNYAKISVFMRIFYEYLTEFLTRNMKQGVVINYFKFFTQNFHMKFTNFYTYTEQNHK